MKMYGGCDSGVYIPDSTDACDSCKELEEEIKKKQDKLTAGSHIVIDDENVISALVPDVNNYYTKEEVNDIVSHIETISIEVVQQLPTEGSANVIYLVPKDENSYYEYLWVNDRWEVIGSTDIDLSNYVQNNKQSVLTALGYAEHVVKIELTDGTQKTLNIAGNGWA